MRRLAFVLSCAWVLLVVCSTNVAHAQLARLVAPGPLAKAHAAADGVGNCQKCHESGNGVSASRCLECHKPIAQRIAAKKGVHRDAASGCVSCHKEHRGAEADLRHLDKAKFNHGQQTGFALEGKHAALAQKCESCHKTRSFLKADTTCSACHADPHKPTLGARCDTCHAVTLAFKETRTRFDHAKTNFALEGSHQRVDCAKCHANKVYRGLKFAACSDCHRSPHSQRFTAACTSCHVVDAWKTQKIDHAKTAFPLKGKHADVKCASCHVQSPVKVKLASDKCTACHNDVHRGEFKQDCTTCHNEQGWRGAKVDHLAKTPSGYALTGKHSTLACAACHKSVKLASAASGAKTTGKGPLASNVDFRGLTTACATCHADVHRAELGTRCETCHTTAAFQISTFAHPRFQEFFGGQHAPVQCERCHGPRDSHASPVGAELARPTAPNTPDAARRMAGWKFKNVSTGCVTCHRDVHLGQLGAQCDTCHSIAAPKFAATGFSHARAKFALAGKHQDVACAKCHKNETGAFPGGRGTAVRFAGVSTACQSCHQDRHLGQLGTRCDTCHTVASFKIASYKHAQAQPGFFVAKHASAKCQDCHKEQDGAFPAGRGKTVRYKGTGTTCVSCHADKHAGSLGTTCSTCHEPGGWTVVSRAFHKNTVFPLEGRHLSVECAACHVNGVIKGTPTRCYDCHWLRRQDDRYRTRLGTNCETCHRPMSWLAVNWNHESATGMRLSPVHRALGCESCHKTQEFSSPTVNCDSCHQQDYVRASNPNHAAAGFPTNCGVCHRTYQSSWQQAVFNHNAGFALTGMHAAQQCAACHKDGVYQGRPTACYSCHRNDYDRSQNPNHSAAGYPTTCDGCHRASDAGFKGAGTSFNHSATYQLAGIHATQACAACHKNNVYRGTPRECYACHQSNYTQTRNPNHAAANYPTTCEACHKSADASWNLAKPAAHTFALVGVHATQACSACHSNGVYKGTPQDCYSCHRTNYAQTKNPNHAAAGFGTTCEACHRATDPSWLAGNASHASFALVGIHATQACAACHKNGVYKGTPRDCYSCHQANYTQTKNPNHAAAGYGTTCDSCHKPTDPTWLAANTSHTSFALVGIHATQACAACHKNGVYKGTPRDCYSCHQANYAQTSNPNHAAAGFATTCDSCHKATDPTWLAANTTHTTFALVGMHATQPCAACHKNNVYKGTPRDCYSCHQANYAQTTNPNHAAAGFATTCDSCHKATDPTWLSANTSHTSFPLVGLHATQPCAACHRNGVYKGTPRDCYSCHQANYSSTSNPNHAAAGFPTTCDSCHKPTDANWLAATFAHTTYSLVGLHATQPCSACHKNNVYRGTPRDCYSCHQANYASTSNPNHAAAGYPTTCDSCHKATDPNWLAATVNHTTFTLVGVHATQPCSACHKNNVYRGTPRDCYSCHQANYASTSNPNHAAAGFPTTCDSCHKATDPNWLAATFSHSTYALVGVHATQPCAACHKNGVYKGTPRDCFSCHQTNYTSTTNPNHTAAGFPTTCDTCHKPTDATWLLATFNHTWFPNTGRHSASCATCHTDPNNYAVFNCLSCHDRASTDSRHQGRAGYRYDSNACYSCHPRGSGG